MRRVRIFGEGSGKLEYLKTDLYLTHLRSYVAGTWPLDPRPPGAQLEGTYRKIVKSLSEKKAAATSAGGDTPSMNGSSNI